MRLNELLEAEGEKPIIIMAKRMMKFSLKSGENSLGVDLKNMKCEFFSLGSWLIYIGKPNSLKDGVNYDFENDDKPGFTAYRNTKLGAYTGFDVKKTVNSYDEFLKLLKSGRDPVIIIDPELTKDAKPAEYKPKPTSNEFYGLGEWGDPYRKGGEYFLVGPYETRALAKQAVDRRHKNGQPQGFHDWVAGTAKIFDSQEKVNAALKKLKLQEIDFKDDVYGDPVMWRLREV